jgi:hypothetical protein
MIRLTDEQWETSGSIIDGLGKRGRLRVDQPTITG